MYYLNNDICYFLATQFIILEKVDVVCAFLLTSNLRNQQVGYDFAFQIFKHVCVFLCVCLKEWMQHQMCGKSFTKHFSEQIGMVLCSCYYSGTMLQEMRTPKKEIFKLRSLQRSKPLSIMECLLGFSFLFFVFMLSIS